MDPDSFLEVYYDPGSSSVADPDLGILALLLAFQGNPDMDSGFGDQKLKKKYSRNFFSVLDNKLQKGFHKGHPNYRISFTQKRTSSTSNDEIYQLF